MIIHAGYLCHKPTEIIDHTNAYKAQLHAVVTLEGTVSVEGMKSSYYMEVDAKRAVSSSYGADGRALYPLVQSFKVTI